MTGGEKALACFGQGYNCAQSVLLAYPDISGLGDDKAARLMSGFGGGIAKTGRLCGALSALVALIGLAHGREQADQMDRQAYTYLCVQESLRLFEQKFGAVDCGDLLNQDIREENVKLLARQEICPRFLEFTCDLVERYARANAPEEKPVP